MTCSLKEPYRTLISLIVQISTSWNKVSPSQARLSIAYFFVTSYCDGFNRKTVENTPKENELDHKQTGRLSSARTNPFERTPLRLFLTGLFGCTSVVIISEMGVWFSHHWEAPSFEGTDAQFEDQVLNVIRSGDADDQTRMPSPFPLAEGDGVLNSKFNVQILISTPKDKDSGNELFTERIDKIV